MGKIKLKRLARPQAVARRLSKRGLIMARQLPDGSYVIYKHTKKRKNHESIN